MAPLLFLEIRSAYPDLVPLSQATINPQLTAASVTMDTQSGFNSCRIGYRVQHGNDIINAYLPEPVEVDDGAVMRLTDGANVLFEGVVTQAGDGSITADGMGLWATRWAWINAGGPDKVTMGAIIRDGFERCPWLRLIELVDTGVYHQWSELHNRSLSDAINQMLTEGGVLDNVAAPWMFLVYEDGNARIVPKLPGSQPDHVFSYDPQIMERPQWTFDTVDAVCVALQDGSTTPWVYRGGVDPTSKWLRRETLPAASSVNSALAAADTYLAQHSSKQISVPITLPNWTGLTYRPGESVRILGFGDTVIDQVQHDLFAGTTQIQIGEPTRHSWTGFTKRLVKVARAVERDRDYTTGSVNG